MSEEIAHSCCIHLLLTERFRLHPRIVRLPEAHWHEAWVDWRDIDGAGNFVLIISPDSLNCVLKYAS